MRNKCCSWKRRGMVLAGALLDLGVVGVAENRSGISHNGACCCIHHHHAKSVVILRFLKLNWKVTIGNKMSHHVKLFKITKVTNSHNYFTTKVINIHCKYIVFTLCLTELSTVSKYLRVTVKRDEKVVHNTLTKQSKLWQIICFVILLK